VLVLGDHGGHALPGLIDDSRGLGGGAGDGVDVWSAEVVSRVRPGRSDRQVVVESSDWTGVVGENSLGGQEWVEGLNWSALQRERSPLDRHERPQRFQRFQRFPLDRSRSVVDSVVGHGLDWLFYGLYQRLGVVSMLSCWLGMVSCWLGMVGPV